MMMLLRPLWQHVNKVLVVQERFLTSGEKKMAYSVFGWPLDVWHILKLLHIVWC